MKALLRRGQCKVYGYLWLKAYYEVRVSEKKCQNINIVMCE